MPASTHSRAGNLPSELTSFVGRRHEIAEIKQRLSASRLVTLTGVGGAGKSRLALRVAADLHRSFPDGVWFVELAALEDHALLSQAIASSLGVHDRTSRWLTPALAEYLSDKRMLMVLDNCEHLRDACAVLVDSVLRAAPDVRFLTTSRQPLGLTGEHIFSVPTLSVPDPQGMPTLESLSQYEAVNLFVDRAVAVQPTFALDRHNFETVVKVCQRLDGLPLAIELTAVRLRALSLDDILERLEDRFHLLKAGSPGALPRHQTLRALIDWSYSLCSEQERLVWSRLAAFSGGFDIPAAEAVCAGDGIAEADVLDLLAALVDKSIVITTDVGGRVRYRMLETIRQYAVQELHESGTEIAVRSRHRDYFAHLVEQARVKWPSPQQPDLLRQIVREHDNIRAALEFSITETADRRPAMAVGSGLWFFWIASGLTNEGRRWLERALEHDEAPSDVRNRALWVCAYLCIIQGDNAAAEPLIAQCQSSSADLADDNAAAWAVQLRGMAAMSDGHLAEARMHMEDALARHRAIGDDMGILDDSFYLIAVTALLSEPVRAAELCHEAITHSDSLGERWLKSYLRWDLGLVSWQRGDHAAAAASARDGLQLAREFNEQWGIAFCVELLAWIAHETDDHKRAALLFGRLDRMWRRIGAPLFGMPDLLDPHERYLRDVRETLGLEGFDRAFRAGAQLTTQQAIAHALDEPVAGKEPVATSPPEPWSPLTPREAEVATLVAEGFSNKAIAARLVISRRTAEAHVEHILGKLGFTSRAQIAAWLAEHRPSDTGAAS